MPKQLCTVSGGGVRKAEKGEADICREGLAPKYRRKLQDTLIGGIVMGNIAIIVVWQTGLSRKNI